MIEWENYFQAAFACAFVCWVGAFLRASDPSKPSDTLKRDMARVFLVGVPGSLLAGLLWPLALLAGTGWAVARLWHAAEFPAPLPLRQARGAKELRRSVYAESDREILERLEHETMSPRAREEWGHSSGCSYCEHIFERRES